MILLIDIGNTRIKWAELEAGQLSPQRALAHSTVDHRKLFEDMLGSLSSPERVLIANVGGRAIEAACIGAIRERWTVEPEVIVSSAQAAGVTNAYREPHKLGVDRWLAVIAAHARVNGPACVVGVGTAMTIDGVDGSGRHLGGAIVPGPQLMIESLLKGTSDIMSRMSDGDTTPSVFADHTAGAVEQGCAQALAALVERALGQMQRRLGVQPKLLLTGGASEVIAPLVPEHELVPDLVLRGLAVLANADA